MAAKIGQFRKLAPDARVIEVHRAHHYVYLSNQAEVLREIERFSLELRRAGAKAPRTY